MKTVFKPLEPFGFEQIIVNDNEEILEGFTEVEPPVPSWKPVFDFKKNKWVETATDDEKEGLAVDDPTEIDELKRENEELRQRVDMSDEALLELADMVLSATEAMKMKGGK